MLKPDKHVFDTIERMRDGEMDAATGKAIASAAHEICASVQLEIEVAKLRTDYPADMKLALPAALPLGIEQKK